MAPVDPSSIRAGIGFGERVRSLRMEAGLTRQQLAERVGTTRGYLGSIERGEHDVALSTILRYAEALGVDPGVLVTDPAESPAP